jgi:hypothetical protein
MGKENNTDERVNSTNVYYKHVWKYCNEIRFYNSYILIKRKKINGNTNN